MFLIGFMFGFIVAFVTSFIASVAIMMLVKFGACQAKELKNQMFTNKHCNHCSCCCEKDIVTVVNSDDGYYFN